MLPLEVFAIVPLDHRVFQLTHPVGITEDLKNPVSHRSLLPIIAICQDRVNSGRGEQRREPLDRVNIYHTLHVEQVYSYFYSVTMAYLVYWLNVRSIYQLGNLHIVKFYRVLDLL